ncbi:MAG: porin family protein [Phreatobacter sp.]|uniref:outer membrane protein n=1 Tax=Phreatobacter sp. TaxID=1966341 RepID=UPI001A383D12|nr:outer membrane beta-barrel protein [Phreatobacter sp.]MBL8568467.1 porin family protein [Phreatobacter sp.]
MKKLLLAGSLLSAFVSGAGAADLGAPRGPVATAVVAPTFNWTGFHAGADLGYWTGSTALSLPALAGTNGRPSPSGVKLGGHIGYLHQFANNLVLGLEGDLSWLGGRNRDGVLDGFPASFYRVRGNWDGSIRAAAGFAADRALIYTTAGVAFINTTGCGYNIAPPCVAGTAFGGTRVGWTVGAGLAYAVTSNVSVRGEYLYANYGTRDYATPSSAGGTTRFRLDTHTVRLGLSYHFTTGPSAVVVRY